MVSCARCGYANESSSKYCASCGAPLPRPAPVPELAGAEGGSAQSPASPGAQSPPAPLANFAHSPYGPPPVGPEQGFSPAQPGGDGGAPDPAAQAGSSQVESARAHSRFGAPLPGINPFGATMTNAPGVPMAPGTGMAHAQGHGQNPARAQPSYPQAQPYGPAAYQPATPAHQAQPGAYQPPLPAHQAQPGAYQPPLPAHHQAQPPAHQPPLPAHQAQPPAHQPATPAHQAQPTGQAGQPFQPVFGAEQAYPRRTPRPYGGPPAANMDPVAFAATAPPPTTDEHLAMQRQMGPTPAQAAGPYGPPFAAVPPAQHDAHGSPHGQNPNLGAHTGASPPVQAPAQYGKGPIPEIDPNLSPTAISGDQFSVSASIGRVLAGFLVSYEGHAEGLFWPIYQGQNVVGRKDAAPGLDIQIDHPTTSSRHATINAQARPGRLEVVDTGSTNGTFHGEMKIESGRAVALCDGDQLRFGGYPVIVKVV